jgi:hypothetical protein
MYKIKLYFKSNIEGVYTKEEETTTDIDEFYRKVDRMLFRWFKILCPYFDIEHFNKNLNFNKISDIKKRDNLRQRMMLEIINETLIKMDKIDEEITGIKTTPETKREFSISHVEEKPEKYMNEYMEKHLYNKLTINNNDKN